MSNQRPAWFRLTSLAMRPPVPAPARPPPLPPSSAPVPFPPRPTIPIRPPPPPAQAQEPRATPLPPSPPPRAPLTTPAPNNPTPNISPVPTPVAEPPRPNPVATRATPSQNSPLPNLTVLQPTVAAASRSPDVLLPVIAAAPPQSPAARPAPHPSPLRFSPQIGAPAPKLPTPTNSPLVSSSTTTTSSRQSTPKTKSQTPSSSSSKQTYAAPAPIPSPKTIKPNSENNSPSLSSSSSTSYSPKNKPLSHPPSPLTLPPAQLKSDGEVDSESIIEQKNVLLVQQPISNKPMKPIHNPHNHSPISSKGKKEPVIAPNNYHKGTTKKPSEELVMSVITLAGENKGAVMELITAPSLKKINGRKVGSLGNWHQSGSESGMEGKSKSKAKNDEASSWQQPMAGFFNSNVQGVNNSILYHTNCRHNDPGIHLSLTRKPNGDRDHNG